MAIALLTEYASLGTTEAYTTSEQENGFPTNEAIQIKTTEWNFLWNLYSAKINEIINALNASVLFVDDSEWFDSSDLSASDNFNEAINQIVNDLGSSFGLSKIHGGGGVGSNYADDIRTSNGKMSHMDPLSLRDRMYELSDIVGRHTDGQFDMRGEHVPQDELNAGQFDLYGTYHPVTFPWSLGNFQDFGLSAAGANIADCAVINLNRNGNRSHNAFAVLHCAPDAEIEDRILSYMMLCDFNGGISSGAVVRIGRNSFEAANPLVVNATPLSITSMDGKLYVLWWFDGLDPGHNNYKNLGVDCYEFDPTTNVMQVPAGYAMELQGVGYTYTRDSSDLPPKIRALHISTGKKICLICNIDFIAS